MIYIVRNQPSRGCTVRIFRNKKNKTGYLNEFIFIESLLLKQNRIKEKKNNWLPDNPTVDYPTVIGQSDSESRFKKNED
jgi:hypothetical protein